MGFYPPETITPQSRVLWLYLANRGQVNGKFILSINAEKSIQCRLIVSGNGAGAGANRLTAKIQVLADVADVYGNYFMGCKAIAPFHTVRDSSPDKRYRRVSRIRLPENCINHLFCKAVFGKFKK